MSIQVSGEHPASLRNGFTAYGVISLVNGLFATIARGKLLASHGLDASTGRQTTRFCRTLLLRYVFATSASIATRPTSVTTADALLTRTGWAWTCPDLPF